MSTQDPPGGTPDASPTHFPRPELARDVLARMAEAPRRPLLLTGARGIGKSTWLRLDLVPLARESHWWPLVIDVTEPAQAHAILLQALRQAAAQTPVLLMLDGSPGWTQAPEGSAALGALLTQIGRLPSGVSVLLVTQPGPPLARLVDDHAAAGLALSTPVEIPPLGDDFLQSVAQQGTHAQVLAGVPPDEQRKIFDQLLMRPGEYLAFLEHWHATNPDWPPERALARYRAQSPFDRRYAQSFMRATPLQQQLLVAIARGKTELFSVESRQHFGQALGAEAPVAVSDVDAQLRKLEARQWIVRAGAAPARFADDGFALWVRALAGD